MKFGKSDMQSNMHKKKCPKNCQNGLICLRRPTNADDYGDWKKCSYCQGYGFVLTENK